MNPPILIVPGVGNSGPDHWQTLWELADPTMARIRVENWDRPVCEAWVSAIEDGVRHAGGAVVVVAHSLGCLAFVHWAARHIEGALAAMLVAVPDPDGPNFPMAAQGFAPLPLAPLPCASIVVSSLDDPYSSPAYAERCAAAWGSMFVDIGHAGHINGASELGDWPAGLELLDRFRRYAAISVSHEIQAPRPNS